MKQFTTYFLQHLGQISVVLVLVAVVLINYFIPQKITFLNVYYLPVILAGYFVDIRRAIMGALLCILMVYIYVVISPEQFVMPSTPQNIYLHVSAWGLFLVLAGAAMGKQRDKLNLEIQQAREANIKLQAQQGELNTANRTLQEYSDTFESRMKELENSKQDVEKIKTKVENTLYATMDATVAKMIIEGRLRNEKRKVSVMFSDLVGFTNFSEERSPELVVRDLNSYLNHMESVILDYRGHIDKYMGDGIMSEFGVPLDYENYRLLSVMAGLKMQEKLARLEHPWQMRIGIASGSAIMGIIGSRRQAYTTIGDVVNLAARMEKACPPGSVLIDAFTAEGVRRFFDVRLMKDVSSAEIMDEKTEEKLDELHQKLSYTQDDVQRAELYYRIGKMHLSLGEALDAVNYFERALLIDQDNDKLKVAFAEATIMRGGNEKIKVRGRKQRVAAYEVIGIKDILLDRKKFPASFLGRYPQVEELIEIPEDAIIPVEALDGCIGHSKVVALLSYAIAQDMGVTEQERMDILHAAFAADIGKAIIPHHLLNRMGSLNENELKEVQKHPVEGVNILKKMGYNSELMLRVVRNSHENFNGSGYPDGLTGEKIPIGARIVVVADTYDALTSWRPYRERWDRNATFDELQRGLKKGLFDPKVVRSLVKVLS